MGRQDGDASLYAASILRNKALVALDMHQKEGQDVVRRLAAQSDVVIENFRPGTLERWGLGYEDLRAENPKLVMVRISGYGQTGPYSGRPGYGVIGEAVSGLRSLTGDPDRPPARINTSLSDYLTGLYAALGAMMALNHRERTGQGQMVDAALYECAFSFLEPHVPAFDRLGEVAQRSGSALPGSAPNNLFETADRRHVHITAISNPIFRRLCESMGRPELANDPRFLVARDRAANAQAIDEEVQAWVGSLDADEVDRILAGADVPAARIYTVADTFSDPHYRARQMLVQVASRELGSITVPNVVPRLSLTPGEIRHAGGPVGGDTRDVLSRCLGMSDQQIEALEKAKVVFSAG
jgi:crotonobetainyl-CoA:carnitine CoA-transferase CaiB-like acyl-CoA transferase